MPLFVFLKVKEFSFYSGETGWGNLGNCPEGAAAGQGRAGMLVNATSAAIRPGSLCPQPPGQGLPAPHFWVPG